MFSAQCPSCAAPVVFAHPAAVSAICERCRSTVVRADKDLSVVGKAAPLGAEISILRIGARGSFAGAPFVIRGALRKGREGVRWTEWWLVFEDGQTGWLAEGNGAWWIFAQPPRTTEAPARLAPGDTVEVDGALWQVIEAADATLLAAEGSLPTEAVGQRHLRYADLRGPKGEVGTLDLEESPARLWAGMPTDLARLKMEGTRPVAGWSDPVAVNFEGPALESVRNLRCPSCGALLSLWTPLGAARRGCEYCGALFDVDAEEGLGEAVLVRAAEEKLAASIIPLGKRGRLDGIEWQVIGSLLRYVTVDGDDYQWEELLLWNPWRGYRWLIRGVEGHWNLGEIAAPAAVIGRKGDQAFPPRALSRRDDRYRRYNDGVVHVRRVLGEFWWHVREGDTVRGVDWISPPNMISVEITGLEEAWTASRWIDWREVGKAFGVAIPPPTAMGPTAPNPWAESGVKRATLAGFLLAILLGCVGMCGGGAGTDERIAFAQGTVSSGMAPLTASFSHRHVPLGKDWVTVSLAMAGNTLPDKALEARITLTGADGSVWERRSDLCSFPSFTLTARIPQGDYVAEARLEGDGVSESAGRSVDLTVRDRYTPVTLSFVLGAGVALGAAVILRMQAASIEARRWANADA